MNIKANITGSGRKRKAPTIAPGLTSPEAFAVVTTALGNVGALKDPATGEELSCYASGAGDLGLVWTRYDQDKASKVATGRHVREAEAAALLAALKGSRANFAKWSLDYQFRQARFIRSPE